MRITCKITAAMKCGVYRHPMPKWDIDQCYLDHETMDIGKLMRAMDVKGVTFDKNDNGPVAMMANEFLQSLERIVKKESERIAQEQNATERDERIFEKGLDKCVKKIEDNNLVCYVRFYVEWVNGHVRFKIGRNNPNGLKGQVWRYCWSFCVDSMRVLMHMQKMFKEKTNTVIELQEGDGCEGVMAEAKKQNDWFEERDRLQALSDEMAEKRKSCPHRKGNRCNAPKSAFANGCCLLYDGKCRIPEVPEEFKDAPPNW